MILLAEVSQTGVVFFALSILFVFLLLFVVFCFAWRISQQDSCPSPYSKLPLRRTSTISYYATERILRFLYVRHEYANQMFDFQKASFCRETGRIFQDSINWYDVISVDWTFLQKRHPGTYVSWGSLTWEQQSAIRDKHGSLEGYQTEYSSPRSAPSDIEPVYALTKPGPLYVDIYTSTLVGWKEVPGTNFELLIVQRPKPSLNPTIYLY